MAKDYSPTKTFYGDVDLQKDPTSANHAVRKSWADANLVQAVHPDSANYAEIVIESGVPKIRIKNLLITDVTSVNFATIGDFVGDVGYVASDYQKGDIVILATASPAQLHIQNGGSAGTTADWTRIENDLDAATIRTYFSGASGVSYNSGTGEFSLDVAYMRQQLSADPAGGNLLTYNNSTGEFLVAKSSIRHSELVATLTANTPLTITHNLGEEYVQIATYDSSKNKIDLDVVTVNSNSLTIESNTTLTNVQVVVSL